MSTSVGIQAYVEEVQGTLQKGIIEMETESLKKALQEHSRQLRESSEKFDSLKEALHISQKNMENISYASVAASLPAKQVVAAQQTALHSIVVTSTIETDTGEEIIDHIRKAAKAKEGWITVDRIHKAKDRKVVLGCKTEQAREKLKEKLAGAGDLKVEDVQNKDPLVILKDVLTCNTDEDILQALRNQNNDVFTGLKADDDRVTVLYKKRTRNPHTQHVVLRVSPKIWGRLQDRQAVHIDLQRIRVFDQTPLVQCSLCLGFGHGRRLCKETQEKCSHCGGPHKRSQCTDWLAGTAPSCCNCVRAKMEYTEHNTFSDECPVRKKWEVLARARVAYC
ncbi:hypothetical protein PYW08_012928 [Mythimna loreyi]|uniref:Uncharacterized protein n=1 Tax=Mythimna loreyi TaxID=667449 RepID=A0ACC2Q4B5_9NEOP|nr:hypothetical protein PYW08_012928 [Mythimna loreyi]